VLWNPTIDAGITDVMRDHLARRYIVSIINKLHSFYGNVEIVGGTSDLVPHAG